MSCPHSPPTPSPPPHPRQPRPVENAFQPAHSPSSSQELLSVSSPPSGTLHPGPTPTQFSFSQVPSHSIDGMKCPSHWPESHFPPSPRWHWPPDWLVTPEPPPPAHPCTWVARRPALSTSLRATACAPSSPASGSWGDPARALAPPPGRARLYIYCCAASRAKPLSGEARLGVLTSRG